MGLWPGSTARTLAAIQATLTQLTTKVNAMSEQQIELNTVATQIEADVTAIKTAVTAVAAEIAALQAANPALDFGPVNQALTDLGTAVGTVTALEPPAPPAPAP